MAPETADRRDARPTARIDGGAINSARVMVEAFRLASDATDAPRILNGILDGLVSLVDHDAAGVYVVDALGERISHSLARGCINPAPVDMRAPFDDQGVVGRVLAGSGPLSLHDQAGVCEGRDVARSRLVVPLIGAGRPDPGSAGPVVRPLERLRRRGAGSGRVVRHGGRGRDRERPVDRGSAQPASPRRRVAVGARRDGGAAPARHSLPGGFRHCRRARVVGARSEGTTTSSCRFPRTGGVS